MNSEELELSLRTEFEEHLKSVFAEMRQEMSQLQEKVEAEFEKHKTQLSEVFRDFSARVETEKALDPGFTESVVEHLRLARDEGARITATAIAEAEDMQRAEAEAEAAEPKVGITDLRDAINDISSQTSQAAILKTLVSHAGKFTARGAFFIIKNEHFVGWRTFGGEREETDDQNVREIFFPLSSETVLGESVRSLGAVESSYGTYADDSAYLDKLDFGQPEKMFAIPLVARGRGVAVLYADSGEENEAVNVEALETLVRVAGLTVEVIASSAQGGNAGQSVPPPQTYSGSTTTTAAQPQKENRAENEYRAKEEPAEYRAEEKPVEADAAKDYQPEAQPADYQTSADYNAAPVEEVAAPVAETSHQSPSENYSFQSDDKTAPQNFADDDFEVEVIQDEENSDAQEFQSAQTAHKSQPAADSAQSFDENYSWNAPSDDFSATAKDKTESFQTAFEPSSEKDFSAPAANDYQFENNQYESGKSSDSPRAQFEETAAFDNSQFESPQFESPQFDGSQFKLDESESYRPADKFIPQTEEFSFPKQESYDAPKTGEQASDFAAPVSAPPAETVSQPAATPPVRSRFSDRNVDLPIEVTEDERRLHNDARRFARLLVSEIKLYNEQKVKEGRESHDLYERLREAIDRSREMYDKRVQPPVAAKFDYFHYELVSTLAEGEQAKLGGSYQGATI